MGSPVPLCKPLVKFHSYYLQLWSPMFKKNKLEQMEEKAKKSIWGIKTPSYGTRFDEFVSSPLANGRVKDNTSEYPHDIQHIGRQQFQMEFRRFLAIRRVKSSQPSSKTKREKLSEFGVMLNNHYRCSHFMYVKLFLKKVPSVYWNFFQSWCILLDIDRLCNSNNTNNDGQSIQLNYFLPFLGQ